MRKIVLSFFILFGWIGIAQESFTLSPESVLTISGTSTLHDWEVTATSFKGSLTASEEVINALKIEVPVSEIKSERGATMDNKMYAALKAEEHSNIFFTLREIPQEGTFIGLLTIAGVEKEVSIEGALRMESDTVKIAGMQEILLKDYGMEPPTAMFGQIVVGETVEVGFDFTFTK